MTAKSKCTELGGLYKTMPWTLLFGAVGALSISAFPATSGFTSKSLIIESAVHQHLAWVWLVLEIASAGVFLHAGIKFPYFVFFAKDRGLRPGEGPKSMLVAMAFMSFLCIFLGVYPQPLYQILPYPVHYQAYSFVHVVSQLQLLMFSALVFFLFLPMLKRTDTISIDTDWFYRKGSSVLYPVIDTGLNGINALFDGIFVKGIASALANISRDVVARAVLLPMVTLWIISGYRGKRLELKKAKLYNDVMKGTVPVGIGAGVAAFFISLLFFLTHNIGS
jgi:multicomponent Na+:H+ antiporter subunit D